MCRGRQLAVAYGVHVEIQLPEANDTDNSTAILKPILDGPCMGHLAITVHNMPDRQSLLRSRLRGRGTLAAITKGYRTGRPSGNITL